MKYAMYKESCNYENMANTPCTCRDEHRVGGKNYLEKSINLYHDISFSPFHDFKA